MLAQKYEYHSGLYIPKRQRRPTAIDLFCGCGGFSTGLIQAGFEVVAAVDNDAYSALTYMVNLGSYPINIHYVEPEDKERLNKALEKEIIRQKKEGVYKGIISGSGWIRSQPADTPPVRNFWFGDIRKISGKDILDAIGMKPGEVDLVVGGPPCQGFSMAGRRDVMDPRNSLVFDFARMVLEIQPKFMVMENVPGMISMVTPEGIPVIDAFCKILADGGFGTYDALKKTLLLTSGAGAILKGQSITRADEEKAREPDGFITDNAPEQMTMFQRRTKKTEKKVEQISLF